MCQGREALPPTGAEGAKRGNQSTMCQGREAAPDIINVGEYCLYVLVSLMTPVQAITAGRTTPPLWCG